MSSGGSGAAGTSFAEFFAAATGREPGDFLRRLAEHGLRRHIAVPDAGGRAGVILAWLWRRLHGPEGTATPRRLVYALPQRSLVEPTAIEVGRWLTRLGLADQVALQAVGAGAVLAGDVQWRRDMHRPAILIGTADTLVSKALNRGFGVARITCSIDFALTTNGAQWIFAEAGQCRQTVSTMRDIAQLSAVSGTTEPFAMSVVSVGRGKLCTVRRLSAEPGDYPAIAGAAAARHRPGSRTLIVMNSVAAARQVHAALAGGPVPCLLLHTQFRGRERAALAKAAAGEVTGDGQIVVSTQVIEAGLDLAAALVVTEAAPWPSVVLRAGQCGDGAAAELWWVPPAGSYPYRESDVAASVAALRGLEGVRATLADLAGMTAAEPAHDGLAAADVFELFDTAPDLTGAEVDIARYVCDADDLEAQLIWATWTGEDDGHPPPAEARIPSDEWRCRAPLAQVGALAARARVWRLDWAREGWTALAPEERVRPGEILLIGETHGGYDPVLGFDPALPACLADSPSVHATPEPVVGSGWVSLRQHSEETRDQAAGLLASIRPVLTEAARRAIVSAAYLHDVGKAHPIWQDALCSLVAGTDRERIDAGQPWAKSGIDAPLVFAGGVAFRHELASLLLIDGPLRKLIDQTADRDLVRYLVLAHHGKLRLEVRDPDNAPGVLRGLEQGAVWVMRPGFDDVGVNQHNVTLTVDLTQFCGDGAGTWTATARGLLDRYGPFVLAYLETLVRIADWRSSGSEPLP